MLLSKRRSQRAATVDFRQPPPSLDGTIPAAATPSSPSPPLNTRRASRRSQRNATIETTMTSSITKAVQQQAAAVAAAAATDDIALTLVDTDPLIKSAKRGDSATLNLLLKSMPCTQRMAYINARDRNGSTALHHAVWPGKAAVIATLLYYGADGNIQNNRLNTPLHLACEKQHLDIIKVLIENGTDPDILNWKQQKCYEVLDAPSTTTTTTTINEGSVDDNSQSNQPASSTTTPPAGAAGESVDLHAFVKQCCVEHEQRVLAHLATNVSPEDRNKYRAMFDAIDVDNDGFINVTELHPFLAHYHHHPPTKEEITAFFQWFDMDNDGQLSFNEFLRGILYQKDVSMNGTLKKGKNKKNGGKKRGTSNT